MDSFILVLLAAFYNIIPVVISGITYEIIKIEADRDTYKIGDPLNITCSYDFKDFNATATYTPLMLRRSPCTFVDYHNGTDECYHFKAKYQIMNFVGDNFKTKYSDSRIKITKKGNSYTFSFNAINANDSLYECRFTPYDYTSDVYISKKMIVNLTDKQKLFDMWLYSDRLSARVKNHTYTIPSGNETDSSLRLNCSVRGYPSPNITWKLNDVPTYLNVTTTYIPYRPGSNVRTHSSLVLPYDYIPARETNICCQYGYPYKSSQENIANDTCVKIINPYFVTAEQTKSTGNTVNVLMISGIVVALLILIVSPVVYCLTRTKDISSSDNHHQPDILVQEQRVLIKHGSLKSGIIA